MNAATCLTSDSLEGWEREQRDLAAETDRGAVHQGNVARDGKLLYGVIVERIDRRGQPVHGEILYIHASADVEARWHFQLMYPNRRTHRIGMAAPCLAFKVENKQGTIVSA